MEKNENRKLNVNRVIFLLIGGLLMFAVMSFTVIRTAKNQNEELTKALDVSRYEAGRLLADANEQLVSGDYTKAKLSLTTLFENQPGSAETVEGKKLMMEIESAEEAADTKWEAAKADVQKEWSDSMAAELRAKSDKDREQLESDMEDMISAEWENVKDKVRADWEEQL